MRLVLWFSLKDNLIFQNGVFHELPKNLALQWYVGDLPHRKTALFWTSDRKLFEYDGQAWRKVANNINRGNLAVLAEKGQALYNTFSNKRDEPGESFELKSTNGTLAAFKLPLAHTEAFTQFMTIPPSQDVIVINRKEILLLKQEKVHNIWNAPEMIHITGHMPPTYVPQLSGIVFDVGPISEPKTLMWLGRCREAH